MALLIRILSIWPALAGLGVTVAIIPATMGLGKLLAATRRRSMAAADARVKLITEVITGARSGVCQGVGLAVGGHSAEFG